jgi:hypothetical protein
MDESVATVLYNGTGILEVCDIEGLSRATGLSPDELTSHEDTFQDGPTYAPWPTTLRVLKALCQRQPQPALELLARLRADAQRYALEVGRDGDPWWVQGAREGDKFARRLQQWHDAKVESVRFLRDIVDGPNHSLAEDFLELREMYLDLVRIAPSAIQRIKMTRAKVSEDLAAELQRLVDRPLPRSAELFGAERPDETSL